MDGVRPLLLIRADANSQIGSGHLMRCWALAQAWLRRGGRAAFACRPLRRELESQIIASGCEILPLPDAVDPTIEAGQVQEFVRTTTPTWLVFDGYPFDLAYQQGVADRARVTPMLWIDDSDSPQETVADLVLNQNVFARSATYPGLSQERLLCGPSFTLLRGQFHRAAEADFSSGQIDYSRPRGGGERWRVLVTMGGADAANGTSAVLQSLAAIRRLPLEVDVALGANNPHGDSIRELATTLPLAIRIEQNVGDMAAWMRRGDLAIAAAGSTAYELAACGVPAILVVAAPNQSPVARGMAEAGAALNLGGLEQFSPALLSEWTQRLLADGNRRRALAETGRRLVDGRGAERVAQILWERSLQVRPATIDDARQLFAWQQDPAVRAASFTAGPADFAQHRQWLEKSLSDPNLWIDLFTWGPQAVVGCVRWAIEDGRGTIGIVIDRAYRGRGLAPPMLRQAVRRLREIRPDVDTIDAWIRPGNQGSRRSFAAAGFQPQRTGTVHGQPAELWQLEITSVPPNAEKSAA